MAQVQVVIKSAAKLRANPPSPTKTNKYCYSRQLGIEHGAYRFKCHEGIPLKVQPRSAPINRDVVIKIAAQRYVINNKCLWYFSN